ncbi:MAG: histone deacetylase [Candidatus Dormibacteraeota bacterium]|nr:histone deacetylase [Candidatus Dormibacteraeota bacterium]
MIALLTNPEQAGHRVEGHPERPDRVVAILDAIKHADLGLSPKTVMPAEESLIRTIHAQTYLKRLDLAAEDGGGYLDPDTYLTSLSMLAARTAAGAVVTGVQEVLAGTVSHAFAVVRPPGHHAETARAMGFCLLNNIAIGVAAARVQGIKRIAIIDFDVHHGNGTQHTFETDADLFYASTHQFPFYPGTGAATERGRHGTIHNLPLAAGSGDREFLGAYEKTIGPALDAFRPELILVSAGFDAHRDDPLAGLEVSTEGYGELAALIRAWADRYAGSRSIWVLEGGYDLPALGASVVACLHALSPTR